MKKIYIVISLFIVGSAQLLLSLILAVVTTANRNIIGGADLPTFLFIFVRENGGIYFALACLGVLFIIVSIVVGVMKKKLK